LWLATGDQAGREGENPQFPDDFLIHVLFIVFVFVSLRP
jgi:hypothetical protein